MKIENKNIDIKKVIRARITRPLGFSEFECMLLIDYKDKRISIHTNIIEAQRFMEKFSKGE